MSDPIPGTSPRGVSGLVMRPMFEYVALQHGNVEPLVAGLGRSIDELSGRFTWVDWDTYVILESRAGEQLRHVPNAFLEFGRFTVLNQRLGFVSSLFGQLAQPLHIYRLVPRMVPRFHVACLDIRLQEPDPTFRRLRLEYRWTGGATHTAEMLACIQGQLTALPRILGEPEARVMLSVEGATRAVVDVRLNGAARASASLVPRSLSWVQAAARRTLGARKVGDELLKTSLLLSDKLDELEEANARLREEAAARQRAVEEVQASEERYRILAETARDAIYLLDTDGTFRYINRYGASLAGASPAQVVGQSFFDLGTDDAVTAAEEALEQVLATGEPLQFQHPSRWSDRTVWYDTQLVPLPSGEGRVEAVLGVTRDITAWRQAQAEREQMSAQIQQTQKLESLGVLAGGIAHDFNNLLTIIAGNAELAEERLGESHSVRAQLRPIREASRRAAELCRLLLAYAGKGQLEKRQVDLSEAVRDLEGLLLASLTRKVEFRYELGEGLPRVEADPAQIRQIILNVVVNAGEALGDQRGRVTIRTSAADFDIARLRRCTLPPQTPVTGRYAVLEVTDTGCGMDEATVHRAFDPFFSTKFTGRGLGLAAVLGIVRRTRGAIHIDSTPGRGTRFQVILAAEEISVDEDVSSPVDVRRKVPPPAGRVLLVDDEPEVREVGQQLLESLGLKVTTAVDGLDALERFRAARRPFDVVILDLAMPRMDGEEAYRALRQEGAAVPVIISSGYGAQVVQGRFVDAAGLGFVHKPYELVELIEALRRTLHPQTGSDEDPDEQDR